MMRSMSEREAWDALGLPPGEYSAEELHAAYRQRAKKVHPDAGGDRQEWDGLAEAYALLSAGGEHIESDQQHPEHWWSRTVWGWRGWRRPKRVGVVLVVGALLLVGIWRAVTWPEVPTGISLLLTGYAGAWWLWWIARELRREAVKPLTWALMKQGGFWTIQPVDSPGMVK